MSLTGKEPMTELETALQQHNWSLQGWKNRVVVDKLMSASDPVIRAAAWEKYCPWSVTNGGYIVWSKT